MGVGLDLFGGLVCVTSVEKDKFPTENFPEIKGSHREISGGKYTTERKETSSCPNSRIVAEAPEKTALLMKAILDADEPGSVEPQRLVLVAVVAIVSRI